MIKKLPFPSRKYFIASFVIVVLLIIAAAGFFLLNKKEDQPTNPKFKGMTFQVKVPQNTPAEDTVYIYLQNQKNYKMEKIDKYQFSISLTEKQLEPENGTIRYRYSRNGYDFRTAEYLEPDNNDYFWTEKGRRVSYNNVTVQKDTVKRWRWFPQEGTPIVKTSSIEPKGEFLPRTNGQEFRSGQIIEDLYVEAFRPFFDSTAAHMKKIGYKVAEIDPPLQLVGENGLPKVRNLIKDNPNYPDDETLKEEILAYKKVGLTVVLAPQLCCEALNTEGKNKKWWDAYFAETTKFLVSQAKIAEETGVDYFHYAIGAEYQQTDYAERWSKVFKEIRKHYKGKLGEMVWNLGSEPGAIIPDAGFIKWGKELDYFYVAIDTPLSLKESPSDEELEKGAAKMLDGVKQLYDRYKKPIFVRTTYFNVKKTWKGNSFYDISSIPWLADSEKKLAESKYEYSGEDLARVVNAYFRAIAERPWIFGYAQFGYAHWENPLAAELSVRGKPAEDVWRKWNEKIYKD